MHFTSLHVDLFSCPRVECFFLSPPSGIYLTAVMMITSVSVIMTVIVINIHYRGPSDRFLPHRFRRFLLIHVMGVQSTDSSVSSATSAAYFTPTCFTPEDDAHVSTVDSVLTHQRIHPNSTQNNCSCTSSSNNAIVTTDIDLAANFKRIDDRLKRQASYSHNQSAAFDVSYSLSF